MRLRMAGLCHHHGSPALASLRPTPYDAGMQYRGLGKTGLSVSEVSLGTEHLDEPDPGTVTEVVAAAVEGGVNLIDLITVSDEARGKIYAAVRRAGGDVTLVAHLGMAAVGGGATRDLAYSETSFKDLLDRTGRDSVGVLMLHLVDRDEDFDAVFAEQGLLGLAARFKDQGLARSLSVSTHRPAIGHRAIASGVVDSVMFPVNPAHDLFPGDTSVLGAWTRDEHEALLRAGGGSSERADFYLACERAGVAILAIKAFAGGLLLERGRVSDGLRRMKAEKSQAAGITLTPVQCLSYALARPAVSTAVAGCRSVDEVQAALAYARATDDERDFSAIDSSALWKLRHRCVYCEHCQPCPWGIRVGAVMRLLDIARSGMTEGAASEYAALTAHASDCTGCLICEERCPFGVPVAQLMESAASVFGR
jgi:uncharacterized protein